MKVSIYVKRQNDRCIEKKLHLPQHMIMSLNFSVNAKIW